MADAILFSDYELASKAELTRAVQTEINQYMLGEEFESRLLSALVLYRHPYCRRHILIPTRFMKRTAQYGRSGYHFHGYFEGIGWKSLSWHKCITPTTFHDEVRNFLRWNLIPSLIEAKGEQCEHCGSRTQLEVNHAAPTFEAIYRQVEGLFSAEETDIWAYYDWDSIPGFRLPSDHPVFLTFMAIHNEATLETLCKPCHAKVTRQQRAKGIESDTPNI